MNLTLPIDSEQRKEIPLRAGCYEYFPAALAGVAMHSKAGNDKHNKGEPLHHARGKSMDHEECIERHMMDLADLRAALARGDVIDQLGIDTTELIVAAILGEANALCWRALALSQQLYEDLAGAPLAPRARLPERADEHEQETFHPLGEEPPILPVAPHVPMAEIVERWEYRPHAGELTHSG